MVGETEVVLQCMKSDRDSVGNTEYYKIVITESKAVALFLLFIKFSMKTSYFIIIYSRLLVVRC